MAVHWTKAGVPERVIRLLRFLFTDQETYFVVRGEVVVAIGRGVKQGCPLSDSLFALAVDLLLMMLAQGPAPLSRRIFAYADDLSLVLRDFVSFAWGSLGCFLCFAGGAASRGSMVPLRGRVREQIQADLEVDGGAGDMAMRDSASYLGVMATAVQWDSVIPRILA